MRFLTLSEVLRLHQCCIAQSGGTDGVRDLGAVESAVAQPQMTFGGKDLYPDITAKAAAICFSLVKNHPFIDGNNRVGHAAMETFLVLNGYELIATIDESEQVILTLAAGTLTREALLAWIASRSNPLSDPL